eukprot:190194_1
MSFPSSTRSRLAVDMNPNHYLHPELDCQITHPEMTNQINIGLNKMPQAVGWGTKFQQDWFHWTGSTADGLNEQDIKDFDKNIPSVVLEKELNANAEVYFDESWDVVKDIPWTTHPFPKLYGALGDKTKQLVDKIYNISGCPKDEIIQFLVHKMGSINWLKKVKHIKQKK